MAVDMSEIEIPFYRQYSVRLTRLQALRALVFGGWTDLPHTRVSPVIAFGTGTTGVNVECWGAGGGGGE